MRRGWPLLALLVACTARDASELDAHSEAVEQGARDPFTGMAPVKLLDLPMFEGNRTLTLLSGDAALLSESTAAARGDTAETARAEAAEDECALTERHLVTLSSPASTSIFPKGSWDAVAVSADKKWMAASGIPGSCQGQREVFVADLTGDTPLRSLGAATSFAFMGPRVLLTQAGAVRAFDPASGAMAWETKDAPAFVVAPNEQRVFVYGASGAKFVDREGHAVAVTDFPAGRDKHARFFPDSSAVELEVSLPEGLELYRVLPGELTKIADHVLRPATFSQDRQRLAFITQNVAVQDVNLVSLSDLTKRITIGGIGSVATMDLSPEGRSVVVTGATADSGGSRVCAAASSDTDAKFVPIANLSKAHPLCQITGDGERVVYMTDVAGKARVFTRTRSLEASDLAVEDPEGFLLEPASTPVSALVSTNGGAWQLVQLSTGKSTTVPSMKSPLAWEKGILYYLDAGSHLRAVTSDGRHHATLSGETVSDVQLSPVGMFVASKTALLRLDMPTYALHPEDVPSVGGGLKGPVDPAGLPGTPLGPSGTAATSSRQEGEEVTPDDEVLRKLPSLEGGPRAGQEPPSFTTPPNKTKPAASEPQPISTGEASESAGCSLTSRLSASRGAPPSWTALLLLLVARRRKRRQ